MGNQPVRSHPGLITLYQSSLPFRLSCHRPCTTILQNGPNPVVSLVSTASPYLPRWPLSTLAAATCARVIITCTSLPSAVCEAHSKIPHGQLATSSKRFNLIHATDQQFPALNQQHWRQTRQGHSSTAACDAQALGHQSLQTTHLDL